MASKLKLLTDTQLLRAVYSVQNQPSYVASRYLDAPANPIRPKINHIVANRDKDTLWWRVALQHVNNHKKVVRSWCARRTRNAFVEALEQRGFDKHGRKVVDEDMSAEGKPSQAKKGLTGSLDIIPHSSLILAPYKDVLEHAGIVVDMLISRNVVSQNTSDTQASSQEDSLDLDRAECEVAVGVDNTGR